MNTDLNPLYPHLRHPELTSARVFSGGYLSVDKRTFGNELVTHVREVVQVRNGVCVLAILDDGTVPVVYQHRQAIDQVLGELPAGVVDDGEDPETAARRELSEEAGVVGGTWTHLLHYAHAEGYSTGWMDLYLAVDCQRGDAHPEASEELELQFVPLKDFLESVRHGHFCDAKTLLAGNYAMPLLGMEPKA